MKKIVLIEVVLNRKEPLSVEHKEFNVVAENDKFIVVEDDNFTKIEKVKAKNTYFGFYLDVPKMDKNPLGADNVLSVKMYSESFNSVALNVIKDSIYRELSKEIELAKELIGKVL